MFPTLTDAIDRAADEGRTIRFWWRDDDAVRHTPALDRLLSLGEANGVDVTLAIVPAAVRRSLADRTQGASGVTVAVHGWSHANHAPGGEKPAEFGAHRALPAMLSDALRGRAVLREMFADADATLFVPPWNRIAPALVPELRARGYDGVSCFGAARPGRAATGPDTHVDPVDWRGSRGLLDPARIEADFAAAVAAGDIVGLLTHHLCFDEKLWAFCTDLLSWVRRHRAVTTVASGDLLTEDRAGSNPDGVRDLSGRRPVSAECRP